MQLPGRVCALAATWQSRQGLDGCACPGIVQMIPISAATALLGICWKPAPSTRVRWWTATQLLLFLTTNQTPMNLQERMHPAKSFKAKMAEQYLFRPEHTKIQ